MTRRDLVLVLILIGVWTGCGKADANKGGLVAVIESDLMVPKDVDRVSLRVKQYDQTQMVEERDLSSDEQALPQVFRLKLAGSGEVTLVAVGYKAGVPRAQRTAIVRVPSSYVGLVRMPLNFLCEHMVTAEGSSSCGPENTCIQGLCGPARLNDVPRYDERVGPRDEQPRESNDGGAGACFDALSCFSDAQTVELDDSTCSFEIEIDPDTSSSLNVALQLPPISAGVCGEDNCLVVLTAGDSDGWVLKDANRVVLSAGICHSQSELRFRLLLSRQCPTRRRSVPLCAPQSSVAPNRNVGILPPSGGDACAGPSSKRCELCGVSERVCTDGYWSEWSECVGERECKAGIERGCEGQGKQLCRDDCTWGECLGKHCTGPYAQECGHCGIQSRNCENGEWSEWSTCQQNGECSPGDPPQVCGAGGRQDCNGICHWATCEDQVCPGAGTQTCGNCGTQTRACDPSTGLWSAWSECRGEGVCKPNAPRECANGGTETCAGNCQWEGICRGQECDGSFTQNCPMCGTQERTCDSDSGDWSEFGECKDQGACTPDQTRACGNMGRERCGADCRWSGRCEGQTCIGEASESCRNCGVRTRRCNADTGDWFAWGECAEPQGACAPSATGICGSNATGTRTCGEDCRWGQDCTDQECLGSATPRDCGCRPTTYGVCDPLTGHYSEAPACSTEPCRCTAPRPMRQCVGCHPPTAADCDPATGQWKDPPECMTGPCECTGEPPRDDCGCHGMKARQCDTLLGVWEKACPTGPCTCEGRPAPSPVLCCGKTMPAQCSPETGEWVPYVCPVAAGQCMCADGGRPPEIKCCGGVVARADCDHDTGSWKRPVCEQPIGMCPCDETKKPQGQAAACGPCNRGTQLYKCDHDTGTWVPDGPTCMLPEGEVLCSYVPEPQSRACAAGDGAGKQTCLSTCKWGACESICGTKPSEKCGACDLGTQSYVCDETSGKWAKSGDCKELQGSCKYLPEPESRTCTLGVELSGTQKCLSTCVWGECVRDVYECEGDKPSSRCGPCGVGIQNYTCDSSNGQWVKSGECKVAEAAEYCEPKQASGEPTIRDCVLTEQKAPGAQLCNEDCTWGPCISLDIECKGDAPPGVTPCGVCGKRLFTCDRTTGTWVESTSCAEPTVECNPKAIPAPSMSCVVGGSAGYRSCTSECTWGKCVTIN